MRRTSFVQESAATTSAWHVIRSDEVATSISPPRASIEMTGDRSRSLAPCSHRSSATTSPGGRRDSQYAAALPIAPGPSTAYVNSVRDFAAVTSRRFDRVPVILEGRHWAVVVDPPLPLLDRQLAERLCH